MEENLIITLEEKQFIASGVFCKCYQHPTDAEKCIKVPTDNKKAQKRLRADLRYYRKLYKDKADSICYRIIVRQRC